MLGRSWRFAGRSLGRTRTRSAAVVTAIAVTGALGAAGSTFAMNVDGSGGARQLPTDAIVLQPAVLIEPRGTGLEGDRRRANRPSACDLARVPAAPLDEAAREQVASILPAATVASRGGSPPGSRQSLRASSTRACPSKT